MTVLGGQQAQENGSPYNAFGPPFYRGCMGTERINPWP